MMAYARAPPEHSSARFRSQPVLVYEEASMGGRVVSVLLIEDNPAEARLIEEMLTVATRSGRSVPDFRVERVGRLQEGLSRLDEAASRNTVEIDAVLLNLNLPDSQAKETFATTLAHAHEIPIVALIGRQNGKLARQLVGAGAQDCVPRQDVDGLHLAHTLICSIERQKQRRALQQAHDRLERRIEERSQELIRTSEDLRAEISERRQAEQALLRRSEELAALNAIAATLSKSFDLDDILNTTLDVASKVMDSDVIWVQLVDDDAGSLSLAAHRGFSHEMVARTRAIGLNETLTGRVARSGEPIVLDEIPDAPSNSSEASRWEGLHAFAAVPVTSRDKVVGVLGVSNLTPRHLSAEETELLTAIGREVGVVIENVRLADEAAEVDILQELNRLRSELIANVSHELRTPLGLIKVCCTTLLRTDVDFDDETRQGLLHDIDEETDRLESIVDDLLNLSQIESARLQLVKRPTDLARLAWEAIKAKEAQLERHHLTHDFVDEPLLATVDPKRIEQVLSNLLDNAIKYSPEGGTITVVGRGTGQQAIIWIRDQGIGIPPEELDRVFERFYRVHNDVTKNVRGTGLGLAVCRGIVEAHGGRIWAESTPGEGSTFYFSLNRGA
jgi:signal transduction histidine kinase